MKKLALFSTVVFLLVGTLAYGQVSIGPKVGATMATMPLTEDNDVMWWSNDYEDVGYIPGVEVGIVAEIPILDFFAVQPEILFTQKGYTVDETYEWRSTEDAPTMTRQMRNYYLQVPVLGKFIYETGKARISVMAGPYFGYATNGKFNWVHKSTYENSYGDVIDDKCWDGYIIPYADQDYTDFVNRFDIGATVGAGVAVPICGGENDLLFDFRYNHGFIDYNNWNNLEDLIEMTKPDDYKPLTNRQFSLSMGYLFALD